MSDDGKLLELARAWLAQEQRVIFVDDRVAHVAGLLAAFAASPAVQELFLRGGKDVGK